MSVNAAGQHAGSSDGSGDPVVRYPNAFRADVVEEIHGYQVEDPYRWLEDRSDPATSQWIDTQAEIFGAQRENWETIDHWRSRIEALLGSGTVSPRCGARTAGSSCAAILAKSTRCCCVLNPMTPKEC